VFFAFPRRLASCTKSAQLSALWRVAALESERDIIFIGLLLEHGLFYVGLRSSLWGAGRHEWFDGVLQAFQVAMDNRACAAYYVL
jgi:hypothetical protein